MWKAWEGRTVDGRFPLQSYLGGSDHSGVFLTARPGESGTVAIKLISCPLPDVEPQLARWKSAGELRHVNLLRVFETGRCELDGTALLYAVEEYAEENLAQILPERALTPEEARAMLPPLLHALQFVHDRGFVHGSVQPSNILAVGDQVKLSSDTLRLSAESNCAQSPTRYDPPEATTAAISKAGDVWQLGMTLIEVLTQRLPFRDRTKPGAPVVPAGMPAPFREIAAACLQLDEGKRWSVAQILAQFGTDRSVPVPVLVQERTTAPAAPVSGQRKPSRAWSYLLGLAAVAAVAFLLIPRPKPSPPAIAGQSTPSADAGSHPATQPPANTSATADSKVESAATASTADGKAAAAADQHAVVRQVLPDVAQSARRTIHGTIQIRVKVKVDAAGNVTEAKVESGRVSKYFKRLALGAAQDWKFSPAPAGEQADNRQWRLQFRFSRAKTVASATTLKR